MGSRRTTLTSQADDGRSPSLSNIPQYNQVPQANPQHPGFGDMWPPSGLASARVSPTAMHATISTPMDSIATGSSARRRDTSSTSMSEDVRAGSHTNNAMAVPSQRVTWAFPSDEFPSLSRTSSAPTYANLPAPGKSPSVASSGFLEDGIFEPGSTYQTLHQTLRSHVFRTAYSTPIPLHHELPDLEVSAQSVSSESVHATQSLLARETSPSVDGTNTPDFELDAALEFKLWKAWTEEVSNWVS